MNEDEDKVKTFCELFMDGKTPTASQKLYILAFLRMDNLLVVQGKQSGKTTVRKAIVKCINAREEL